MTEPHSMSAEVKVSSRLDPDKVTVLQIHGIGEDGGKAPPLVRIALQKGDLFAVMKTDKAGKRTDAFLLKKGIGTDWFKVEIGIANGQLEVAVDNERKLSRDLAYWKFPNYFKAGCYPQATKGTVEVVFRKLTVK